MVVYLLSQWSATVLGTVAVPNTYFANYALLRSKALYIAARQGNYFLRFDYNVVVSLGAYSYHLYAL
jgi:hypothetical protein